MANKSARSKLEIVFMKLLEEGFLTVGEILGWFTRQVIHGSGP